MDLQEDITEKRAAEQEISWLATHDTLTGLANRFSFREQLTRAYALKEGFALHWIDLDRFKEINDNFGHPVGDALLQDVAARLGNTLRPSDTAARLGGDEFALIQAYITDPEQATKLAERLLGSLGKPYHVLGHDIVIGASVGIAIAPAHGTDPDSIQKHADLALYAAKAAGRGRFAMFQLGQVRRPTLNRSTDPS